jgi:uncharacterized membrane protein
MRTSLAPSPTSSPDPEGRHGGRRDASRERLWEIDVLRTAAIVMMVAYHLAYDVRLLAPDLGPDVYNGGWRVLQVACASSFLALVGVSFWIRHQRLEARGVRGLEAWRDGVPRAAQVAAGALAVSVATLLALGSDDAVRFGILHLIAVALLVALPLLVRFGVWNAAVGGAAIGGGLLLDEAGTTLAVALVIGLDPGETGVDWVPLLPWIGLPLLGVALGALLYPGGRRHPWLRGLERMPRGAVAAGAPGRRSLTIYLLHQPILVALVAAVLLLAGVQLDGL